MGNNLTWFTNSYVIYETMIFQGATLLSIDYSDLHVAAVVDAALTHN